MCTFFYQKPKSIFSIFPYFLNSQMPINSLFSLTFHHLPTPFCTIYLRVFPFTSSFPSSSPLALSFPLYYSYFSLSSLEFSLLSYLPLILLLPSMSLLFFLSLSPFLRLHLPGIPFPHSPSSSHSTFYPLHLPLTFQLSHSIFSHPVPLISLLHAVGHSPSLSQLLSSPSSILLFIIILQTHKRNQNLERSEKRHEYRVENIYSVCRDSETPTGKMEYRQIKGEAECKIYRHTKWKIDRQRVRDRTRASG